MNKIKTMLIATITAAIVSLSSLGFSAEQTINGWTPEKIKQGYKMMSKGMGEVYTKCFMDTIVLNYNYKAYEALMDNRNFEVKVKPFNTAMQVCGFWNEDEQWVKDVNAYFKSWVSSWTHGTETIVREYPQINASGGNEIDYFYTYVDSAGKEQFESMGCFYNVNQNSRLQCNPL